MMYLRDSERRILAAFKRAVPLPELSLVSAGKGSADVIVRVGSTPIRARWILRGWPREVEAALALRPRPDVLVAPSMSPGARAAAREAGVGWVEETGAAEVMKGPVVILRTAATSPRAKFQRRWTPASMSVAEALLTGSEANVASVATATGLSTGTVANALRFFTSAGLLWADAARGRLSGRRVESHEKLLDEYLEAASSFARRAEIRVGVLWRDPVKGALDVGAAWERSGRAWAASGALAASALAPIQTEVAPLVIYVVASSESDLHVAAAEASLDEVDGGRLLIRAFLSAATERLSSRADGGLRCAPWPRVVADLIDSGVRGEDAANHLREQMIMAPPSGRPRLVLDRPIPLGFFRRANDGSGWGTCEIEIRNEGDIVAKSVVVTPEDTGGRTYAHSLELDVPPMEAARLRLPNVPPTLLRTDSDGFRPGVKLHVAAANHASFTREVPQP